MSDLLLSIVAPLIASIIIFDIQWLYRTNKKRNASKDGELKKQLISPINDSIKFHQGIIKNLEKLKENIATFL